MKNKIFAIAAVLVIIAAIIVAIFKFNVDYCYRAYNLVSVEIGQEFNKNDIKTITDEVFSNEKIEIHSSGVYSDNLILNVNNISDQQKELLSTKLNEKYGIETTVDSIKVTYIPNYRLRDLAKTYLVPMLIAAVVGLAYMVLRYKKVGITKVILQYLSLSILAEVLYVSIIAITRFQINRLVMPGAVTIFFVLTTFLAYGYEKQLKEEKE